MSTYKDYVTQFMKRVPKGGCSLTYLRHCIAQNYNKCPEQIANYVRIAVKKMIEAGEVIQNGQKFRLSKEYRQTLRKKKVELTPSQKEKIRMNKEIINRILSN